MLIYRKEKKNTIHHIPQDVMHAMSSFLALPCLVVVFKGWGYFEALHFMQRHNFHALHSHNYREDSRGIPNVQLSVDVPSNA